MGFAVADGKTDAMQDLFAFDLHMQIFNIQHIFTPVFRVIVYRL